jgi:thiamine transporter
MGMLDLADGFYAIASTWYIAMAQVLFDYIIVYAVVGFAGLFRKLSIKENETKIKIGWLLFGCILGGILKFSSHYLSGVLFWNDPSGFVWGFTNGFLYSFVYNGAYMIPSIILVSLLMFLIAKNWPFLLRDVNYAFLQKREKKDKE